MMINKCDGSRHLAFWVEIDPIAPSGVMATQVLTTSCEI